MCMVFGVMFLNISSTKIMKSSKCVLFIYVSDLEITGRVAELKIMGQDPCVSESICSMLWSSPLLLLFSLLLCCIFYRFLFKRLVCIIFPWKSWPSELVISSSSTGSSVTSAQFSPFIGHTNFIRNSINCHCDTVHDNFASSVNQALPCTQEGQWIHVMVLGWVWWLLEVDLMLEKLKKTTQFL